jgi:hypothetical protein
MVTRIAFAAILTAAGSSPAAAQNAMPAPKPAPPPMTSAPASNTTEPNPPPPANATQNGLRVGEGAVNGVPLEIKRMK